MTCTKADHIHTQNNNLMQWDTLTKITLGPPHNPPNLTYQEPAPHPNSPYIHNHPTEHTPTPTIHTHAPNNPPMGSRRVSADVHFDTCTL